MSLFDFRREIPIPTAHTITKRLCTEKIFMILSLVQLSCVNKLLLEAAKYLLKVAEHFRPKVIFNEAVLSIYSIMTDLELCILYMKST